MPLNPTDNMRAGVIEARELINEGSRASLQRAAAIMGACAAIWDQVDDYGVLLDAHRTELELCERVHAVMGLDTKSMAERSCARIAEAEHKAKLLLAPSPRGPAS